MSTTRGYHRSSTPGNKTNRDDDGIPYNPDHLKDECFQCHNKDDQGKKVKGHRAVAPLCPRVRSGEYPMAAHWKKIMDGQTKGDKKTEKGRKGGGRGS